MPSQRLSKLPVRELLSALKQGNSASAKLAPNVTAVKIHYKPNQAGRSSFMREELGHLVNANPSVTWTSLILPSVRPSTKDPKTIEAVEKWRSELKESGEKDQQKIVVEFDDGESKTVRLRKNLKGKSILEELLETAGTVPTTSLDPPHPTSPYTDPSTILSKVISATGIPTSATQTSSPAANAITTDQADDVAVEAGLPRLSSLVSEEAEPTGSEEGVRADQDTESREAKVVQEMVDSAKSGSP